MSATPKEIADSNDRTVMREWILQEKDPRKIQELFHIVSVNAHAAEFALGQNAIRILIAESTDASAQRLEKSTKRLLLATYVLVAITLLLTYFTLFPCEC
jgi:hypothetical protein